MSEDNTFTTAPHQQSDPLEQLIDAHWLYVFEFLKAHHEGMGVINKIEFHYKSAFRHGFKHAHAHHERIEYRLDPEAFLQASSLNMPGCDD